MTNVFGTADKPTVGGEVDATHVPAAGPGGQTGHEQVVFCQDAPTGLRAIIAIYSTALGPSLGGTRFYPYQSEDAALADVLNLSRAMAYKNALAGLDLGGGKAVIIGDPARLKSEALLRAYGRFVQSLGGRYITACDVGTYSEDMDISRARVQPRHRQDGAARRLRRLVGADRFRRLPGHARGRRACLGHRGARWPPGRRRRSRQGRAPSGPASRAGRRAGRYLRRERGARSSRLQAAHPAVGAVAGRAELLAAEIDIYSPCALGGAINDDTVETLGARIVCGGANNQLAHTGIWRSCSPSAASSTHPITWSTRAGSSRSRTNSRASTSTGRRAGPRRSSVPRRRSSRSPTRRAYPLRWRQTGWLSGGCPR